MSWLIIALPVIALLAYLLSPAKPTSFKGKHQADLPGFFSSMVSYMRVGSVLHVQHEGSERELRFRKVALSDGARAFDLELPNAPWARRNLSRLRDALRVAGFDASAELPMQEGGTAFVITRGLSVLEAFRAAEVAREALGLDVNSTFTIHMAGGPSLAEVRRSHRSPAASDRL